jgi:DNA polymerase V
MQKIFALVDCNNFYVSCERAFNPSLEGRPVVVLSSNDGCCVSRSDEAKELGVPMGIPLFKIKDLVHQHKIVVLSSNYELYADMSARVMNLLETFISQIEYYSVDEAFLPLPYGTTETYEKLGEEMRLAIKKQTGIPVSIGIGPTRTLAKVANELARHNPLFGGVFSFVGMQQKQIDSYLQLLPVEDVWGIGRKSALVLKKIRINTAYDITTASEAVLRKYLKVMGARTRLELLGTSCLSFSELRNPKKGICSTRSFGKKITNLQFLEEAVSTYIDTACNKLRKQKSVARYLTVHIRSSYFSKTQEYVSASKTIALPIATSYTPTFISSGIALLRQIYQPGVEYAKAGVYLTEITQAAAVQQHLLNPELNSQLVVTAKVSSSVDEIRKKFGNKSLIFGSMGITKNWLVRSEHRTPRYTTKLSEVLTAR